jgi:hypothetical protein
MIPNPAGSFGEIKGITLEFWKEANTRCAVIKRRAQEWSAGVPSAKTFEAEVKEKDAHALVRGAIRAR